ncbi:PIN domain nuclease [Pelotomaculum terephthalicicum JT]|uniref:PIN/TRAM domain-containing protein n=1 Tax=Pelotomaculum terephthalicicum TaxID=206393 RepID=UPI0009D617E1|nr:PIN domain-containing protein [Pelotomaculum terephthalicicum]MCG9969121.1 PIN domain nuclease [Pelotomaculum terephthalicicum JT]OPY62270.1 MAG: putative PIN and TRAM-domain containing protein precursor [Pelotomaculum sp. PtaU1.Bin065]
MVKKIIYIVLVAGFTGLGFAAGMSLINSGLVAFINDLPQQLKFGLIGLSTLIGLFAGIPVSPLLMRGAVRLTVFIEQYLQRAPTQDLVMGSVGLITGLIIANLMGSILSYMGPIGKVIWLLITLLLSYLGLSIGIKKREDLLALFSSFPKFGKERGSKPDNRSSNAKILDTSVIIDGRIADLCESGFIEGTLIIPAFVIDELRHIADSSDLLKRNRGRRGLDILNKMRKRLDIKVQIYDNNRGLESVLEVDSKLVKLGQKLNAKIITNDYNLNKVAELQGVKVLNINELANAIKPVVLPGEEMVVQVVKDGKEIGQGVAYLDDGTMIVVEGGKRYMNQTLSVLVTSVLQTAAGRMIFARPKFERKGESGSGHYNEVNVIG